jgi:hypothetical protein
MKRYNLVSRRQGRKSEQVARKWSANRLTVEFLENRITPSGNPTLTPPSLQTINEGTQNISLGTLSDSVSGHSYTIDVNWGDSTPDTIFTASTSSLSKQHNYDGHNSPYTTYTPHVTATDQSDSGRSAGEMFTVRVKNVAPTPLLSPATSTSPEGTPLNLTGSATDPSNADTAAGFTFTWAINELNPDGVTFTQVATGSTGPGSDSVAINYTPDDNGTFVVTLNATDKDGATGYLIQTIDVTNVAPTATIKADDGVSDPPTSGTEGNSITLTGLASDPSSADTAAGFDFEWAVTKNGADFAFQSSPGVPSDTFTFTPEEPGTYVVTLNATDQDGDTGPNATVTITVVDAALHVSKPAGSDASLTEGDNLGTPDSPVLLANFTDNNPSALATDFTATIDWGDGTKSTASFDDSTILPNGDGSFGVYGSHQYTEEGTYFIGVTINDVDGAWITLNGTAQGGTAGPKINVSDAALTGGTFFPPIATEGAAVTNAVLFHFTDADPNGTASDYTATVTWGDGAVENNIDNPAAVQVVPSGDGFDVVGSHTYLEEASGLTFSVSVHDHGLTNGFEAETGDFVAANTITRVPSGGGTLQLQASSGSYYAELTNQHDGYQAGYGNGGYTYFGARGQTYTGDFYQSVDIYMDTGWAPPAATYDHAFWLDMSPTNALTGKSDYRAEHNFRISVPGDGTIQIFRDGEVTPMAILSTSGWYTFEITYQKGENPTDPVTSDLLIFDSDHHLVGAERNVPANFDAYSGSPPAPMPSSELGGNGYAWITLWQNGFAHDVLGIDNLSTGLLPVGASTSTFSVADAALHAGAFTPPTATEGAAFSNVVVFHFTDDDPNGAVGDYVATVNTGDATLNSTDNPSNVKVVASGGGFDVQLSYTYAEEISGAAFSVSVTDHNATASGSTSTFTVADADLSNGQALNIGAVTGMAFTVPVATFKDPGGAEPNASDPSGTVANHYSATISWGDTGTSAGTITYDSGTGTFTVSGTHTYATAGNYPVSVTVLHETADPLTISGGQATVSSRVWVNDNWVDAAHPGNPQLGDVVTPPAGETAPTNPSLLIFGENAFATIQDGINADAPGGTAYVLPGTYVANGHYTVSGSAVGAAGQEVAELNIDKPLNLIGPNPTYDPNSNLTPASAQAVIVPGASDPNPYDPNAVIVMLISSSNVTVQGITVDGINPALSHYSDPGTASGYTGYVTAHGSSTPIDAAELIASYANVANVTLQNNVVRNAGYLAIDFNNGTDYSGGATTGSVISTNLIQNASDAYHYGDGVNLYNNFYADVTHNVVQDVRTGVQLGNYSQANPSANPALFANVANNTVSATRIGLWDNLSYASSSPFTFANNSVSALNLPGNSKWDGIFISSIQGTAGGTFQNNTIDGTNADPAKPSEGYNVWNTPTTGQLLITGGTVSNVDYGVWVNTYEGFSSSADATQVTVSGTTISASKIGVYVEDSAANSGHPSASATITGNTQISTTSASGVDVKVSGGSATVAFTGAAPATLQGTGNYIALTNGAEFGNTVDASQVSFNGFVGATGTLPADLPSYYGVEDKVTDYLDDPTLGYVKLANGNVFVAHSSEAANAAAIQRGIDVASSGNTINVQAGTYVGDSPDNPGGLNVSKPLTLLGAQAGVDPRGGRSGGETVILPSNSDPNPYDSHAVIVVYVSASNVTIDGFTVNGDNPNLTSGVVYHGADIDGAEGIVSYEGVGHITVQNNIVRNTTYTGIDFYNDNNGGAATSNNLITQNVIENIGGGGFLYGIGVLLYNNFYAAVTNNVMDTVRVGVQTGNFYNANPGGAGTAAISDNQITAVRRGIFYNLHYSSASPFTVAGNHISAVVDATSGTKWDGILISSQQGTVSADFTNNTIDGSAATTAGLTTAGYEAWNTPTTGTLLVSGGSVTGVDYGVWVNTYEGYGPSDAGPTQLSVSGLGITAKQIGIWVEDSAANTNHPAATATISGNTDISTGGNGTGILVSGANASTVTSYNHSSVHDNKVGIQVNGGSATVDDNHIYNNVTGIEVLNGGTLSARYNFITNNTGAAVLVDGSGTPSVTVQDNDLSGNGSTVVQNNNAITVDAAENYWGSAYVTPAAVAGLVSGNVNFEPILTTGDADPVTAGFQPDLTKLTVDITTSTASPTEGATYTLNLAPINPTSNNATLTQWDISWGDSMPDTVVTAPGIPASVTHVYAEEGNYTITATAKDELGNTATSNSVSVSVADAALTTNSFKPPVATEGAQFNGTVLNFSDADPNGVASDYSALVTLGDSNTVTLTSTAGANGQIVAHGDGTFDVNLSYTYAEELTNQTFSVSVTDHNATASASTSTFSVADADLTATAGSDVSSTEGQATGTKVLATFTDANPGDHSPDFTVTVKWGDGNVEPASFSYDPSSGVYTVTGDHIYAQENTYPVSVTITDDGGSAASIDLTAVVNDLAPSVSANASTVTVAENATTSNTGTFSDYDDPVTITQLSGPAGTISQDSGTSGAWTWTQTSPLAEGDYTVVIQATGDQSVTTSFTVHVTDVAPSVSADHASVSAAENQTASNTGTWSDFDDVVTLSANHGTVTDALGGTWTWSGIGDENSPYTVIITAKNADGSTATTSFTVSFTDVAPTVAADHASVNAPGNAVATNSGTFADFDDAVTISASHGTVTQSGSQSGTWSWSSPGNELSPYTVTIKATNADGSTATTSFTVTFSDAPLTNVTGYTLSSVNEGTSTGTVTVASFKDGDLTETGSHLSATIDWGDGGTSTATLGNGGIVATGSGGFDVKGSHTYDDGAASPGTAYTIKVNIVDSEGSTASTDPGNNSTIKVLNVAPTVSITNVPATSKPEGTAIVLGSTVTDPSGADTAAGFTYLWTVTRNGVSYGNGGGSGNPYTGLGASFASFTLKPNRSGTYVVTLKVTDKDSGATTVSTSSIAITNVSPTPTITGPASGVPYQPLDYTGTFTDPGTGPDGETYTFLWKVTQGATTIATATTQNFTFTPTTTGTYTISFKVTDDAGGSGTVTKTLTVSTAVIETDPADSTKTALYVGGTSGNDTITVSPSTTAGTYTVVVNGVTQGTSYRPTGHIIVYGGDGNDSITLAKGGDKAAATPVTLPAMLFGGAGDDTLDARGSTANNVLVGGDGNDTIYDGSGFNILIGGAGTDYLNRSVDNTIQSNLGTDILIGDKTIYDDGRSVNLVALNALMAEWGRTDETVSQKKDHLTNTTSGGANGSTYLRIGTEILDDSLVDAIFADPVKHWWKIDGGADSTN